jgi:TolA-binding protein
MTRLAKAGAAVLVVGIYSFAVWRLWTRETAASTGDGSQAIWETSIAARGNRTDPKAAITYRAIYNAGHSAVQGGDMVGAVKRFRACYDSAPHESVVWAYSVAWLGVICEQMGDAKKADEYYAAYMRQASPMVLQARNEIPGAWRRYRMMAMERAKK